MMKMRRAPLTLILVLIVVGAVFFQAKQGEAQSPFDLLPDGSQGLVEIVYPKIGCPFIGLTGQEFTIFVNIYYNPPVQWNAFLTSRLGKSIKLKTSATYNGTSRLWELSTELPDEIGFYNLTVEIRYGEFIAYDAEPNAVQILREFPDDIKIVHWTDTHVTDFRGATMNASEWALAKCLYKQIEEINLIHPDFVILSGDLVSGETNAYEEEYQSCYNILKGLNVPVFAVPGNHDGYVHEGVLDGFAFFKRYIGPLNYSFKYGRYHLIGINSYDWPYFDRAAISAGVRTWGGHISDEQLKWVENEIKENNEKTTIMFGHHNPAWPDHYEDDLREYGAPEQFVNYSYESMRKLLNITKGNVTVHLAGHTHYDNVSMVNNTIYVTTTTASADHQQDGYWGYRLIEFDNGIPISWNYLPPRWSIPYNCINYTYTEGTNGGVTCRIENKLKKTMEFDGIEFAAPDREWVILNGTPREMNIMDGKMYFKVHAEVGANSVKNISLVNGNYILDEEKGLVAWVSGQPVQEMNCRIVSHTVDKGKEEIAIASDGFYVVRGTLSLKSSNIKSIYFVNGERAFNLDVIHYSPFGNIEANIDGATLTVKNLPLTEGLNKVCVEYEEKTSGSIPGFEWIYLVAVLLICRLRQNMF